MTNPPSGKPSFDAKKLDEYRKTEEHIIGVVQKDKYANRMTGLIMGAAREMNLRGLSPDTERAKILGLAALLVREEMERKNPGKKYDTYSEDKIFELMAEKLRQMGTPAKPGPGRKDRPRLL